MSSRFAPTLLMLCLLLALVAGVILSTGGDPLELARLGTRFSQGDPNGTEGYDGQFGYYIARDPRPTAVAPYLDAPAYRYQRILLPLLARLLALGNLAALPWTLAAVVLLAHVLGVFWVSELLAGWGVSRWYALAYGLFPGFILAVRLDLPETLAFGLVAGALLAGERGRPVWSWALFGLALFAKETAALFVGAQLLAYLAERRGRDLAGLALVALLPFGLFQVWLWAAFGQPAIGSGGAMATPFELIPFMGLLRIGAYSPLYLGAMLAVFGPAVVLPSLWGLWASLNNWLTGHRNVIVLCLFINALVIPFLPFSTFRETGGLLRFVCGFGLATLLFAGRYQNRRVLNYTFLWIVLNLFLVK